MNGNVEEASSSGNSSLTSDQLEEVEAWQAAALGKGSRKKVISLKL